MSGAQAGHGLSMFGLAAGEHTGNWVSRVAKPLAKPLTPSSRYAMILAKRPGDGLGAQEHGQPISFSKSRQYTDKLENVCLGTGLVTPKGFPVGL